MTNLVTTLQIVVGLSVLFVWGFRSANVAREFTQFGLSDSTRAMVGTSKIALATALLAAAWYHTAGVYSALGMAFFMVCAQWFQFRAKNSLTKRVPSAVLLILCLVIAAAGMGYLA